MAKKEVDIEKEVERLSRKSNIKMRKTEYSYFGLTKDGYGSPVFLCSTNDHHERDIGWRHYIEGSPYNFADELPLWKMALEAVEKEFGDSEEDIKAKERKAKRQTHFICSVSIFFWINDTM